MTTATTDPTTIEALERRLAAAETHLVEVAQAEASVHAAATAADVLTRILARRDLADHRDRRQLAEIEVEDYRRRLDAAQRADAEVRWTALRAEAQALLEPFERELARLVERYVRPLHDVQGRSHSEFAHLGLPGSPFQLGALVPPGLSPEALEHRRGVLQREGLIE